MSKELDKYRTPLVERPESKRYIRALNGEPLTAIEKAGGQLRKAFGRTIRRS